MSQKVVVDQEACIGCGNCEAVCPGVFKLNEDERSQVIKPEGGPDCVEDAIDQCPAEAISWQEE